MQIHYLQYRNNSIIAYSQPDNYRHKKRQISLFNNSSSTATKYFVDSEGNRLKTYTGTITQGSKKRLTKAVSLLIQSTPTRQVYNRWLQRNQYFKINFITLTISDSTKNLTAKEAHAQLLEPMLLKLRRHQQMRSYVWKAELQERGQIHYHITADCFCDLTWLREEWNNLQRKAGLLEDFEKKFGHSNPNSTDIHSVKKIKNIEAYLVKYMSKTEEDKGSTEGKVWDCSTNLKKGQYFTTLTSSYHNDIITKGIDKGMIQAVHKDVFSIFIIKEGNIYDTLTQSERNQYKEHMRQVRFG